MLLEAGLDDLSKAHAAKPINGRAGVIDGDTIEINDQRVDEHSNFRRCCAIREAGRQAMIAEQLREASQQSRVKARATTVVAPI